MEQIYNFDDLCMPLWIKVLFGGLYMVIFVFAVSKTLLMAPKDKRQVTASVLFMMLFFIAYTVFYCVNSDYFSYRDWLNFEPYVFAYWDNEKVYTYLIIFCRWIGISYPYELFRLIVWGVALLLVYLTTKLYRGVLMPGLVLLFLFVLYSGTFSYARASLAMALYFLGVGIIMQSNNFFVKILGIGLAMCSYFLHNEMIVGIAVLPSLIVPFENKKTIVLSLVLLAIMIVAITYLNSNLALLENVLGDDEMSSKIERYNEREQAVFRISTSISYLNFFLPFFLITMFFYRRKHIPKTISGLYRISAVLLMATIAYFVVSGSRSVYTYRIMYITMIPMSIMIAYCYNQGYFKKHQLAIMFFLACVTNLMRLIQSF